MLQQKSNKIAELLIFGWKRNSPYDSHVDFQGRRSNSRAGGGQKFGEGHLR